MSALLQGVPFHRDATGGIYFENGTTVPDRVANGIPYAADGAVAIDFSGVPDHFHQGLGFTAAGRLAAKTGAPNYYGAGAAPILDGGTLAIQEGVTTHLSSGIGYTATSQVNISVVKVP